MNTVLVVVHLFLALSLVGLILIQHGKGADAGAAFGSGASATVFGSKGSANFLSRTTGILALLFFVTSMALAAVALRASKDQVGLMEQAVEETAAPSAPVETDVPGLPGASGQPAANDVPAMPGGNSASADVPGDAVPAMPSEATDPVVDVQEAVAPADVPGVPVEKAE